MTVLFGIVRLVQQNILKISPGHSYIKHAGYTRLSEVGRLDAPKLSGNYETGQLFLHKVFGYRGVILFPWLARVYDRDIPNKRANVLTHHTDRISRLNEKRKKHAEKQAEVLPEFPIPPKKKTKSLVAEVFRRLRPSAMSSDYGETTPPDSPCSSGSQWCDLTEDRLKIFFIYNQQDYKWILNVEPETPSAAGKEVKSKTHTFYQVLIDARDCPFIRAQTEAVTFLGNQDSSRSLYAIPGLDYVAHEDILPYTTTEKQPLQHELFDKFLLYQPDKDPPFGAQDTLRAWQKKNHPWLELSDVHKETTENVRVTVIPFYMGCRDSQTSSVYWWRYCIRLENLGDMSIQLRERHWRIFSLSGTLETVRGRGVVGQEPVLSRAMPAFQYSSHVSLQAPSGHMWGTFRMEREDGYTFDCRIPPFSLESKGEEGSSPSSTGTD